MLHIQAKQQDKIKQGYFISSIPLREESKGFISKTSTPCIFPKISKRSKPVAWSRSVGIVPGAAPGPKRSASLLISIYICVYYQPTCFLFRFSYPYWDIPGLWWSIPSNFLILDELLPAGGAGVGLAASPVCLVCVSFDLLVCINPIPFNQSIRPLPFPNIPKLILPLPAYHTT